MPSTTSHESPTTHAFDAPIQRATITSPSGYHTSETTVSTLFPQTNRLLLQLGHAIP